MTFHIATVIGYHGMENFGDDLFLQIVGAELHKHLGVETIHLHAHFDTETAIACDGVEIVQIHPAGRRIRRLDWIRQLRAALKSDIVVFAAGSIFAGPQYRHLYFVARGLSLLNSASGKIAPIIGLGISLGPFRDDDARTITWRGLRYFETLLLRDEGSAADAQRMGLQSAKLSFDLVPILAPQLLGVRQHVATINSDRPLTIGLSLGPGQQACTEADWAQFAFNLKSALLECEPHTAFVQRRFLVFTTCSSAEFGDHVIADHLHSAFASIGVHVEHIRYRAKSSTGFMQALLSCDALISSRLHPALIAMGTGMPVMQVAATAPKVSGVFDRIGLKPIELTRQALPGLDDLRNFALALAPSRREATAASCAQNVQAFVSAGAKCEQHLREVLLDLGRKYTP